MRAARWGPAQDSFGGLGAEDCAAVRDVLLARPSFATVGECRAEAPPAADPDATVPSAGE